MTVIPIANLGHDRWPIHGKIRLGQRGPKGQPQALSVFRLTSPDEQAIRDLGILYGGTPKAWHQPSANPPDQFEVITEVNELRVFVPPGGLSCFHEFWSGGGCIRRCDGITCEVAQADDMAEVPCLCKNENVMRCKPHSRLKVILPEISFGGLWAMESTGWSAAHGLASMERLISQLQGDGRVVDAMLVLEKEQTTGGRRQFVVPKLRLSASVLALVAGEASIGALHSGHGGMAELGTGTPPEPPGVAEGPIMGNGEQVQEWFDDPDSQIIDAEVVEERADGSLHPSVPVEVVSAGAGPPLSAAAPPSRPRTGKLSKAETKFLLECTAAAEFVLGTDPDWIRHALSRKVSRGRTASSRALSSDELAEGIDLALSLVAETMRGSVLKNDPPALALEEVVAP